MKSERRHELQHNQLADTLGEWAEKLKPYARLIGGLVVLLVVLSVAYAYVAGKTGGKVAAGWDEYFEAIDANDRGRLLEVAEKYAGTSVAPWARIVAADMALSDGCFQLFNNKAEARDLLRQAANNYQTVLGDASDDMLKQRALFGLARAHESLASLEDLNQAREDYKKLLEGWPKGIYAEAAKERLNDLDRRSTKEFYDWFATYEPPKQTSPSGKKPEFLEESLKDDINLPSSLDELNLNDGPKLKDDSGLNNSGLDDIELPGGPALDTNSDEKSSTSGETAPEAPAAKAPEETSPKAPADTPAAKPKK
jgi:hypothetical protein